MKPLRKIRSFVKRDGRMTLPQKAAYAALWPQFGLSLPQGELNLIELFGHSADCILEIGFGSGQSLLSLAKQYPQMHFIGIETYLPGIAAVLLGMQREQLTNIRLYHADAIEILTHCIPPNSLAGVQIFFPDPWPKRRHHKRRLIQEPFLALLVSRLKKGATLHLATDWEDYATQMMRTLSHCLLLDNSAGSDQFADRSSHRPLLTKFENRGLKQGHRIFELQFIYRDK